MVLKDCMLLRRFAYPCRLSGMIARFRRPVPVISMITKEVMNLFLQQSPTETNQVESIPFKPCLFARVRKCISPCWRCS